MLQRDILNNIFSFKGGFQSWEKKYRISYKKNNFWIKKFIGEWSYELS